ncbi:hypothetical protein QTI66_24805 [Variovorax sp. J22R133]|uniref:hypothetical protein n=1 Tax=Variovorax brevis TaxID=3053503 RepID=UPI002576DF7F|nr:hypothetical protein [Variovorax sp. J22R133]MDM0115393.1 hypothetical protein [Variovorax sp. J22R133]
MGTWVLVGLFVAGALQGMWHLAAGMSAPANAPAVVQDLLRHPTTFDLAVRLFGVGCSITLAWLLFNLSVWTVNVLWVHAGTSLFASILQLMFMEKTASTWAMLGWWMPFLVNVAYWAVVIWYVHQLKAQGRLR